MRKTLYSIMFVDEPLNKKAPLYDVIKVNFKEDEDCDNFGTIYREYDIKESGYVVTFVSDSFNLANGLTKLKKENKELQQRIKRLNNSIKEVREYVKSHSIFYKVEDVSYFVKAIPSELLEILDKAEENK